MVVPQQLVEYGFLVLQFPSAVGYLAPIKVSNSL
jgi:hypothetical protein